MVGITSLVPASTLAGAGAASGSGSGVPSASVSTSSVDPSSAMGSIAASGSAVGSAVPSSTVAMPSASGSASGSVGGGGASGGASGSATACSQLTLTGDSLYYDSLGQEYKVNCGIDHFGGDLASVGATSFVACMPIYDKTPDCVGYAYVGGSGAGKYFTGCTSRIP